MPFAVNTIFEVRFNWEHANQVLMNVTHWRVKVAGTGTETDATQQTADWFADDVTAGHPAAKLLPLVPGTCTLETVHAQAIHPTRWGFRDSPVFMPGTRGGSITPNVDAVVTKRCALSGRKYVGEFYVPGLDANDADLGTLTDEFITAVNVGMSWLATDQGPMPDGMILEPIIFHRADGTFDKVVDYTCQPTVRVMTRRTVGRGI